MGQETDSYFGAARPLIARDRFRHHAGNEVLYDSDNRGQPTQSFIK